MAGVTPYTKDSWKKTYADRIRSMTDEELAEFLEALCPSYEWTLALNGMTWFGFLKQEVEARKSGIAIHRKTTSAENQLAIFSAGLVT